MRLIAIIACGLVLGVSPYGGAFQTETIGPVPPLAGFNNGTEGIEAMLYHPSRVYSRHDNFDSTYYFEAYGLDQLALTEAFAKASLRDHPVTIRRGPASTSTFDGKSVSYTAKLLVEDALSYAIVGEQRGWPEASLILYVKEGLELAPDALSESLSIQSELEMYQGIASHVPERTVPFVGYLEFDSSRPHDVQRHSWWRPWILYREGEEASWSPIHVVGKEGFYVVHFSEAEYSALREGVAALAWSWNPHPDSNGRMWFPIAVTPGLVDVLITRDE